MRYLLVFVIKLFSSGPVVHAQVPVWSAFDTSAKLNLKRFNALSTYEVNLFKSFEGFVNNRARLTFSDSGNLVSPKELRRPDFPIPCYCKVREDTLFITAALGLMSGLGITTTVHKQQFATSFFEEADGTPIFKLSKSDSSCTPTVSVFADQQKLTFLKKPSFTGKEIIIGIIEAQFKKFYELENNAAPPLERYYKAKLFFKCQL